MFAFTHLVFMGVSGCGKTTAAQLAAELTGWPYAEADDFHPKANIDKMSAGHPLDDDDRRPWLEAMRDWMSQRAAEGGAVAGGGAIAEGSGSAGSLDDAGRTAERPGSIVTCSALKRRYRDILREADGRVVFVHLHGDASIIEGRLAHRTGHFMPASLLPSQYADLEQLGADEDGVTVDLAGTPREIVDAGFAHVGMDPAGGATTDTDAAGNEVAR